MKTQTFDRYYTPAEERKLFAHVAQFGDILARRDHAWMRLLRFTGLRVGELARLTVGQAREGVREHRTAITERKRAVPHVLYVNRKARTALQDLLVLRREMGYAPIEDEPLVMSRNHAPLSVRSYEARMRKWCLSAGIKGSPHYMRHTLAKRLVKQSTAQDPLGIVQSALGHRSRNSSAIYARPDKEDVAQALEEAC